MRPRLPIFQIIVMKYGCANTELVMSVVSCLGKATGRDTCILSSHRCVYCIVPDQVCTVTPVTSFWQFCQVVLIETVVYPNIYLKASR